MLETNNWIYLDLEKTGCTFLRNKLLKICKDSQFINSEIHSIQKVKTSKPKIITIRDPYNYYLSLWSYGLDKLGGFYNIIANQYPSLSKSFYKERSSLCFHNFLDFSLEHTARYPFDYESWLPRKFDLYTTRILSMIIPIKEREIFSKRLDATLYFDDINSIIKKSYLPEVIIQTEYLNTDFHTLAKSGELEFLRLNDNWETIFPKDSKKINTSGFSNQSQSTTDLILNENYKRDLNNRCSLALDIIKIGRLKINKINLLS